MNILSPEKQIVTKLLPNYFNKKINDIFEVNNKNTSYLKELLIMVTSKTYSNS